MEDDAHQVSFDEAAMDRRCWGSGTTGRGCGRQATSQVGLCDGCHAEILRRVQEGRAKSRSTAGKGRILEMNLELNCAGEVISRSTVWGANPVPSWDEGESQELE